MVLHVGWLQGQLFMGCLFQSRWKYAKATRGPERDEIKWNKRWSKHVEYSGQGKCCKLGGSFGKQLSDADVQQMAAKHTSKHG